MSDQNAHSIGHHKLKKIQVLDKGFVQLLDYIGSDERIVDATKGCTWVDCDVFDTEFTDNFCDNVRAILRLANPRASCIRRHVGLLGVDVICWGVDGSSKCSLQKVSR